MEISPPQAASGLPFPIRGKPVILLDGLLGIGAKGNAWREISALRGNELYKKPLRGCTYRGY